MLDLYGLPADQPGLTESLPTNCFLRAEALERHFASDINNPHFLANLVVHEFEALLFSDPEAASGLLGAPRLAPLRAALGTGSPEEINDSPQTAPSKRLEQLHPGYAREKARLGPTIAARIGLSRIRERCRHFDAWVSRIEALAH